MLNTNWLPISCRKNIPKPPIFMESWSSEKLYAGYYNYGSIVLVEQQEELYLVSCLAHEYKHHEQFQQGKIPLDRGYNPLEVFRQYSYNKAIRLYFKSQVWEMEALEFQHKVAPTPTTEFWLKACIWPDILNEEVYMQ